MLRVDDLSFMGQIFSTLIYCCHGFVLKKKNLLHKNKNSSIYTLSFNKKQVCKAVHSRVMFRREYKFVKYIMKQTQNPYIIRYQSIILDHSMFFLERAEMDLLQWIQTYSHSPHYDQDLRKFFSQMACGYRFLVQHRIEHYDMKPENMLITNGGTTLKIADFGLSNRAMDHYVLHIGTVTYIAPEIVGVVKQYPYVPHSMDVFSMSLMVACLQFEGISNEFFHGKRTLGAYISLERFIKKYYPHIILTKGLIVEPRHRLSVDELLSCLENTSTRASFLVGTKSSTTLQQESIRPITT